VPRNRTARAAVLAGSVQRSAGPAYPSKTRSVLRRRAVLGTLLFLALVLITVSVRESDGGALHRIQNAGATVLRPFQVAAERVAQPFKDVYGYFDGLASAKSQNKRLRLELEQARQQAIANVSAARDAAQLRALLRFEDSPRFPQNYRAVNARVISFPSGPFQQQVTIAAGTSSGIRLHTPVVDTGGNLVGQVTRTAPTASQVTLLTDPDSAVSAVDLQTRITGLLQHSSGSALELDRVTKDVVVNKGDVIVTAGTRNPRYPDLYPRGIPIGVVTSVGQTDTDLYKQIQVSPFVNFSRLDAVAALVSTKPVPNLP
jgi:rod shape-determining protein MreC